jgi:aminoglycoside phosphotransferase (APT) family kinase protein
LSVTEGLVRKLINKQFPEYKNLALQKFYSTGTVNAIYRLGEELYVRLPLLETQTLEKEWAVLPYIYGKVSLEVPKIVAKGKPTTDYPLDWGIYEWLEGEIYDEKKVDELQTAELLANFINELHEITPPKNVPKAGRKPLLELHEITVENLEQCYEIDRPKALELWNELVNTPVWDGKEYLIHADFLKPNLLIKNGRLSTIIDFGSAGVGDACFDFIPAWAVLSNHSRNIFKELIQPDEATWKRAKAYALHQAALIVPYYRQSNPAFTKLGVEMIESILNDKWD